MRAYKINHNLSITSQPRSNFLSISKNFNKRIQLSNDNFRLCNSMKIEGMAEYIIKLSTEAFINVDWADDNKARDTYNFFIYSKILE